MPADHSRKNAIRARMNRTGETFQQAARALARKRSAPDAWSDSCPGRETCDVPDCCVSDDPPWMCGECGHAFDVPGGNPNDGRCPNECR